VSFINGDAPIFFSGSWWHNRFTTEIDGFEWGTFLFPGAEMSPGSGRQHVGHPRAREEQGPRRRVHRHHDAARDPGAHRQQRRRARRGRPADITDEKSAELIANFNALTERDGIAFYPDWPTPTFYDELNAGLQELVNGTKTPAEVQQQLGRAVPGRRRRHRRLTPRMPRAGVCAEPAASDP
jgi:raffinose/stachyose/melibiose transport system substrate-binding protein